MLDRLGYEVAHFVGHSFGTAVLAWIARKQPSRVASLAFLDPICFLLYRPTVVGQSASSGRRGLQLEIVPAKRFPP